ncbi:MAG: hypothetical protein GXX99_02895 [Clostridiales bacterium]|nr:hypothetical protein [Clostridiales bacterium]
MPSVSELRGAGLVPGAASGVYYASIERALASNAACVIAALDGARIPDLKRLRPHLHGLLVSEGAKLSHTLIFAKELSLPILLVPRLPALQDGSPVQFGDASVAPAPPQREVQTADGTLIRMLASVWSEGGVELALASELPIGLLRTETLSDEEEDAVYERAAAGSFASIRLADYGGDKAYLNCGGQPLLERWREQLQKLLPLPHDRIGILLPGITSPKEVREVANMAASLSCAPILPQIGVMLETPQAFLCLRELLSCCAFANVGLNALLRMRLPEPLLLHHLKAAVGEARRQGVPLALCGEPDVRLLPRVLATGIRRLCLPPSLIPVYAHQIRGLTLWRETLLVP